MATFAKLNNCKQDEHQQQLLQQHQYGNKEEAFVHTTKVSTSILDLTIGVLLTFHLQGLVSI